MVWQKRHLLVFGLCSGRPQSSQAGPLFSKEEIHKLLEAGNGRRGPIIETFLYTGLRRDELTHLTWADVDLQRRIVAVQAKDGWHPKDYEIRHIPMAPRLHELLKSRARTESPWVFSTSNGGPHLGHILSRDFRKLVRLCGIKGTSLHTTRHTFASHLVMNGTDIYTVQKLLGIPASRRRRFTPTS